MLKKPLLLAVIFGVYLLGLADVVEVDSSGDGGPETTPTQTENSDRDTQGQPGGAQVQDTMQHQHQKVQDTRQQQVQDNIDSRARQPPQQGNQDIQQQKVQDTEFRRDAQHTRQQDTKHQDATQQDTIKQDMQQQDTIEQDTQQQDTVEQDTIEQDTLQQDTREPAMQQQRLQNTEEPSSEQQAQQTQQGGRKEGISHYNDKSGSKKPATCVARQPGDCKEEDPLSVPPEEDEPEYEKYLEGVDLMYSFDAYDRSRGYKLLQEAAEKGNIRALEIMAYGYIFGSELERNFTRAFEIFSDLSEEGHPIGQQGLGFMYSTGIGVNSNQAKAVLHYVFAALGGHQFSQMAMGYRTLMGVGVVQSCEGSLAYYQKSAEKVISKASLISGGIAVSKIRLMDEDDEVPSIYGVSEDEMVHYQSLFTDSGNTRAQFMLGIYYMFGLAGAQRSFQMALNFLKQAADSKFPAAYSLMGRIYAEGSDEIEADYEQAFQYFKAAADLKHGDGYSGLGQLYFEGKGVAKDKRKALEYFQKAADRGSAEGHYFLGKMYYSGDGVRRDMSKGLKYFQLASHGGHLYAIYSLGVINSGSGGMTRSCSFAVELFKSVSERGKFTRMFTEAQRLYTTGDVDSSFLMYSLLAEMGFEEAQSNVAYLLEQGDLTIIDEEEEQLKRALLLWNRAAAQGYHQARVKLGDYYYYGMGTEVSYEAAATQYRMASDKMSAPQAMFNLGYMYEHGEGLEKDYHLAKRYYDLAAETSAEAIVPANLALLKLNLMYGLDHYKEWLEFQELLGGKWDIYLISILVGCVVLLIIWRTRH